MILKGNIRAHGEELARHLMNARSNEVVELAEMRGFVATNLRGAFAEAEAIASATNCRKYLYSLSINPARPLSREQYGAAIEAIEARLGLSGQPRAVVFHVKEGREHAHVAWSRIDGETMRAVHMAFDRQALRGLARDLALRFGHALPEGLAQDRGPDRHAARFNDVSMAETGQASRSGHSPEERRTAITEAYRQSDSAAAFRAALEMHGYILAEGDKRGFVVVDQAGEVHALTRQIEGVKAKDIRATLNLDALADLPGVQQAKDLVARQMRENVLQSPQEAEKAQDRVEAAIARLEALRDAQKAEWKALKGAHAERLQAIRTGCHAQLDQVQQAVKAAYRPEWAQLYRDQKAEVAAVHAMTATPARRLKALLTGRAGDAFDFENRGTLAGAFNFVLRGQISLKTLATRHRIDRRGLGDRQKAALAAEQRAIRADASRARAEAREEHQQAVTDLRREHRAERSQAEQALDRARGRDEPSTGQERGDSLADFLNAATTPEQRREIEKRAREKMREDRQRGPGGGRGMKP